MPDSGDCVRARFSDVIEVCQNEMDHVVRSTYLTQKSVLFINIERQNVSLIAVVFSDAQMPSSKCFEHSREGRHCGLLLHYVSFVENVRCDEMRH